MRQPSRGRNLTVGNLLMKKLDIIALSKSVHEMGSKLFWWEDLSEVNYFEKDGGKSVMFQIYYDPMSDGNVLGYGLTLLDSPSSTFTEPGTLICSDSLYGDCHTETGSHQCSLTNIWHYQVNTTDVRNFELKCTGGIDAQMTNHPGLQWYPKP